MLDEFSIGTVPTPALVIDSAIVHSNVRRMANYTMRHSLNCAPTLRRTNRALWCACNSRATHAD